MGRLACLLVVAVVALLGGSGGCKSRSAAESEGTPTGPAAPVTSTAAPVVGASASAQAATMRRVSDSDCAQWADHGTDVVVSGFVDAARGCPAKVQEDVASKFVAQRSRLRDGARMLCVQHMNQPYRAEEGACFVGATNARGLRACQLGPMNNPDDTDWAQMIDDLRKQCGPRVAPGAAPPSPTL